MEFESVSYSELGTSPLFSDFINENEQLKSFFYDLSSFKAGSFASFTHRRFGKADRLALSRFLHDFNRPFNPGKETLEAIGRLKQKDVFTVVTGQQLCYLGGPGYSFYKTLTIIALSRFLKARTGLEIVPVFWMADEDHDYEEINHAWLPDFSDGELLFKAELNTALKKGHAAADLVLGDEVLETWGRIRRSAPEGSAYAQSLAELHQSWAAGEPWINAFGRLMLKVFGRYGIVLAGSNHPEAKKLCRPVLEKVLTHQSKLTQIVSAASDSLAQQWYTQVQVTDSMLFRHDPEKGRIKAEFNDEGWLLPGDEGRRIFSSQDAKLLPDSFFESLSPNALLRPVLQQYLLPNLAYTGGAAEVAYHAQLKDLLETFELDMPLILPRFSATVVEAGIGKAMGRLPFSFPDYKKREEDLAKELALHQLGSEGYTPPEEALRQWEAENKALFAKWFESYKSLGGTLGISMESTIRRTEKAAAQFAAKVLREQKKQNKEAFNRLHRVRRSLFPNGILQERVISWAYFQAMYGNSFADQILEQLSEDTLEKLRYHHIIYL